MAGANHANHEFVGENHPNPPNHQNQSDGVETSVTPEGSAVHAQATPPNVPLPHQPPQPEDPLVVPQVPQGAPMEVVMAALGIAECSSTPENNRSRSRSRSPRPAPRRNAERPASPPRDITRRQNHSPPRRNNYVSPPRNRRSPPRRNNRSPPRSGEAAVRGGNPRHSPRRESPSSGDERHRGPLSRRIMDIPLPRGLEKPPTLDKYDGITDLDEHVQSVETALDYRNLRGSIKCKLFPLSLVRAASTWWRNLPPGSIDSWEELCRMFTAHFTTSRRHPKTMANLKAIVQGPEESLRNYIERFNKVSVEVEATDKMKLYLLEEGLREGTKFQEAVGILEVETLDAFFELAQRYIKYEDKQKASEVRRPKNFEVGGPSSQREERRGDEKKREGGKIREAKPPKSQFTYHTPLNAPRDRIISEISNAEFKSAGIRFPKQLPAKPNVDKKKFFRFHKSYGHVTDDCVHLKDAIEILIQKGYARQYVDGQPRAANNNAPRQNQLAVDPASPEQHVEDENRVIGGVALTISRPEDFLPLQTDEEKGALDYLAAHLDGSWENFPGALIISGGGFNPITIGSIKRKFDELEKASPVEEVKITEVKESSVPLAFYREEVPGGSPNFQIPLLVRVKMANFDVRRILVDQGSSCDIMYSGLFKVLQLTEENLVPYVGSDLQGFNGSTTKPWGYVDLIVTFGENKAIKSVKVKFLVVDCQSLYNCIIGRPTLAELFAVSSTIHLKLKYYTKDRQVATINGDIEAARRCFEAASKNLNSVVTPKKKKAEAKLSGVNSISTEDEVELDARTSKKERKQEKKTGEDDLLIKENYRPIPDGEFELVPLGEDPTKGVKIGADLPDLVKRQLKACLRENVELFACSAAEMPGIDPEVACHQLTIDPRASAVVQRRRKQSPEKAEAARKAVKDLLEANFIAEAQYTTWLSNVVLVKKSNGKWRMCVDYTDLNRVCPKDAYPLPNIDKLVDNSSEFKLLSFMDAYSGYNQIKMAEIDKKKIAFMTETGNYYYNVMPFGLKNAGATYQRMMNKVFHNEIGDMLEVYMDDMIVKSEEEIDHTVHLKRVFDQATKFNMRFNPEKCTFGVKAGKFLGFYLTERGIEANPDKCRAIFDYPTPKSKKSIQTLNGMLTSMARFVAKSAQHALPLFKLLRKETTFEWTEECEGALQHLKRALSEPPVLTRPVEGEKLYLYLAVASEAISAVLIRETEQGQKPVYFLDVPGIQFPEVEYTARRRQRSNENPEEARVEFILQEIHEGINGQHIGGRSLARKALRAGYYWPTMQNDAKDHVLKCDKCQRHGDMHLAPANELKTLISPWPFAWWGMDILGPFPTAARQVKYLIVAVDYFTKDVLARFGIPQAVVTDNGTQFTNKKFQEFLATIGTTQHFTSVEHPQTNGQAEAANRVLLRGLRRRMGASKGNWTEELHNVLWSYRTTPHSTTGETPFRLTYGTEAVIPVEIGEPCSRIEYPPEEDINDELLREELDLVEELRTGASLREATLKQKIAARHDKRVIKREFEVGSLVLRRNQKDSREGKLAANWEGPYRVRAKTENGAYHLEDLYGKEIPPLNANVHARRGNTPCEPHRRLVQARQSTQLAMGCSMPRGKISNYEAFLDSSLGASQTLVQFHKLLGNGAYDPRHQEATVIIRRALA
ncbi:hypothetical protein TSUD_62330 [Trifolium subterraneum]|uniref:Integrase catalytic domain-containing protein n=1 Tax=Trifolium subterraneum TaxID=3900 RepID=A0A2Z6MLI8_TRISU|nr:hypothetical protein TSUD_62330 [Trifolium subterraneum]